MSLWHLAWAALFLSLAALSFAAAVVRLLFGGVR